MPANAFENNPDVPLFTPEDPLVVSIPDEKGKMRKFTCKDRAGAKQLDPQDAPITWYIKELTHQIVEEEQEEFSAMLTDAVETGRIKYDPASDLNPMLVMLRWIMETRTEAEQGTLARVVRRPTPARKRSGR